MLSKEITFCGQRCVTACDAKCEKAFGINGRPKHMPPDSRHIDDYAWLSDDEVGEAPDDPGTYEGDHGKDPKSLNKWCVRECERSVLVKVGEPIVLRDFSKRRWNCGDRAEDGSIIPKER